MMKVLKKHFDIWLEDLKRLKICISEAMEIQEKLHSEACECKSAVEHHLNMQEVLSKQSAFIKEKLEKCETATFNLTIMLKEIGRWSEKFQQSMIMTKCEKRTHEKRWNDILGDSITQEMVHIATRYYSFTKLNQCYRTHLEGLLIAFQESRTPQTKSTQHTTSAATIYWKEEEIQKSISKES
ncbi:uncharacterized protein LOC108697577 [Xenopus laevis]|nr:uncharacterized protein LOC108697577 [Xenopus laevis]